MDEKDENKESKSLCVKADKELKTKVKYFLVYAYYSKIKKIYRKVRYRVKQVIRIIKK